MRLTAEQLETFLDICRLSAQGEDIASDLRKLHAKIKERGGTIPMEEYVNHPRRRDFDGVVEITTDNRVSIEDAMYEWYLGYLKTLSSTRTQLSSVEKNAEDLFAATSLLEQLDGMFVASVLEDGSEGRMQKAVTNLRTAHKGFENEVDLLNTEIKLVLSALEESMNHFLAAYPKA